MKAYVSESDQFKDSGPLFGFSPGQVVATFFYPWYVAISWDFSLEQ